jgi:hypothetical protein
MRKIEMIVTNEEQLKNPVIVYTIIRQWMREAGEDFIDQNERFIDGESILEWMLSKGIVSKEKYDYIIKNDETWIQDLLLGCETGVLNGEYDFPSIFKAYQIISEYISESKDLRDKFIYNFCTSFNTNKGGMSASYDDNDSFPIWSHILDDDLKTETMTKENWLCQKWNADISFTDEYNYLKEMSCEEADKISAGEE